MRLIKQHKTSSLFLAFLLLAGICNLLTRSENMLLSSLMFCLNASILIALVVFWMQTVMTRILPSRARNYIITAGFSMILYLLLRIFKYRVIVNSVVMNRFAGYAYYVPLLLLPTLLLATSVALAYGDSVTGRRMEWVIFISAGLVTVIPLTNDIHLLVYSPTVELSAFDLESGSYVWGPFMYLICGWMFLELLIGLMILFRAMRKKEGWLVAAIATSLFAWLATTLLYSFVINRLSLPRMFNSAEIDSFFMLLIFEFCIRSRLIPHNEKHAAFFRNLKVPVLITDMDMHVVHESAAPIKADKEILMSTGTVPVYLDEDTRLSRMKIRAGYAFWTEDEHELREERRRLDEANALISEENGLIEIENKLKEQKARIDAQNQVYGRVAAAIWPKQKRIDVLLDNTDPGSPDFGKALGTVCVFNAYSKRKTNLLLLSENTLPKSNRELFLALSESARFLKCCGIDAAAIGDEYSEMSLSDINDLYDTFETVLETYLSVLRRMTVSLMKDGIRIAMEASEEKKLPQTVLPVIFKESDGLLFFTIRAGQKGGTT
ncbi:hypothetical protein [Butyrivibrio sp. AE2032]|uniref:hypothetical protein n=1 Tax=Butyrivibrio sp. AE2032 TaxID=1458463 RepID=UPI000558EB79|nr:hypothetical protein [Butyrivibrio sp. AE2032]